MRTSSKLLIALALMPASLPLMRLSEWSGWCLVVRPMPRLLWIGVSGATELAWPDGGLDDAMAVRIWSNRRSSSPAGGPAG